MTLGGFGAQVVVLPLIKHHSLHQRSLPIVLICNIQHFCRRHGIDFEAAKIQVLLSHGIQLVLLLLLPRGQLVMVAAKFHGADTLPASRRRLPFLIPRSSLQQVLQIISGTGRGGLLALEALFERSGIFG